MNVESGNRCAKVDDFATDCERETMEMNSNQISDGVQWAQKTPRGNRCLHGDVCKKMSARRGDSGTPTFYLRARP